MNDGRGLEVDNTSLTQLTQLFRKDLLDLCTTQQQQEQGSSSKNCSNDRLPAFMAKDCVQKIPTVHDKDLVMRHGQIDYACQQCGHLLQPGWKGTALRVARPTKLSKNVRSTLRRNMLRKRKQQAKSLLIAARLTQNHPSKQKKRKGVNPNEPPTRIALTDDPNHRFVLDRHFLVASCGSCTNKVRIEGLKRQPATAGKVPPVAAKQEVSVPKKKQQQQQSTQDTQPLDSLEFVPLPPKDASTIIAPPTRIVHTKKKRKPKAPPQKTGKLMDFLSSLND